MRDLAKKRIGIISYNIYCNFTNYGSALQSWALSQAIRKVGNYESVLVAYCPEVLANLNPLDPFKNSWDQNAEMKKMIELTMPAIYENYQKFDCFYKERFHKTSKKYTSENFHELVQDEQIDGFVCGSDTIFCIDEFKGFVDGYYANYPDMQKKSVSYAASFGDAHFDEETYAILNQRLQNFKALGIRENRMVPYIAEHTNVPVMRTIDPTLLLEQTDYDQLASDRLVEDEYLLLYTRRYNPKMEAYAEKIAKDKGLKVVEISLRATNAEKGHLMYYTAGVEEFLSLVKHASLIVTNSFHGLIFGVQYRRPVAVFSREQCDNKIDEVLNLFGLDNHKLISGEENIDLTVDYDKVHNRIAESREKSLAFLKMELDEALGLGSK